MKVDIYDVFVGESASGNPCGVMELDSWMLDSQLLQLTREAAQPVTSFITQIDGQFHIRWFSLEGEINLCGHGSLGAGAAILSKYKREQVVFQSKYGEVAISKKNDFYVLTLPSWERKACTMPEQTMGLATDVIDVFCTRDLVLVLPSVDSVAKFQPNYDSIKALSHYHALIVTAADGECGYVLRYFAPKIGIPEDFATGSAQCSLAPYWFDKLGASALSARQLSSAGGYLEVERVSDCFIEVFAHARLRS
ncbi:PhzF family phenazine biosynthesis protein [Vibrio panuliri]|nr:PhzF family phenazine biosynthesis protein [Vibrio panuliri]KAB1454214.1 PhzF family phenazine biosynthesis protein [Vibrio panuliri]